MTIQQFTALYNERRQQNMEQGYYPIKFSTTKRKTVRKAVTQDRLTASGVPERVTIIPKQTKEVVDTNGLTKLYQAVWEYYLGNKCKRISSEGRYREGIGYIQSSNKGHSDLKGMYNGMTYYIEVKQPAEKHLKSQIDFCRWVNEGGGKYYTVRSFDDMYELVRAIESGDDIQSDKAIGDRVVEHRYFNRRRILDVSK